MVAGVVSVANANTVGSLQNQAGGVMSFTNLTCNQAAQNLIDNNQVGPNGQALANWMLNQPGYLVVSDDQAGNAISVGCYTVVGDAVNVTWVNGETKIFNRNSIKQ